MPYRNIPPNGDGSGNFPAGNGGGGGGGGGVTGGGPGNTFVPFLENGGFQATAFFLFIPAQSPVGGSSYIGTFSAVNWDDPLNSSSYSYRMEDIVEGRVPTVRRVILVYRDLGPATCTVTLTGTNDNQQVVIASKIITIGTVAATGALFTILVDVALTAYRPQLSISRAAAAGPLSIIKATIVGEVEEASL
jgi:hypothetical protein